MSRLLFENAVRRQNTPGWIPQYGPLILWMALIFFASTSSFSGARTGLLIRPLLLFLFPLMGEAKLEFLHFLTRKAAHFAEFGVLALLASRAFLGSSKVFLRRRWFESALLLSFLYALSDEFHQSFVPGRTASLYDSLLDTAGGLAALSLLAIWRGRRFAAP